MAVDGRGINHYLYGCTVGGFPVIAMRDCRQFEPATELPGVMLPFGCEALAQA
jgi:hypothetical protein